MKHTLPVACVFLKSVWQAVFLRSALTALLPTSFNSVKSTSLLLGALSCTGQAGHAESPASVQHIKIFQKDGRFAAWPANGGMWAWGDEILICYTEASHRDATGHSYDPATAWSMFARSLDGGETWTREDAHAQGITGSGHDHRVHQGKPLRSLDEPIDFSHPDFALLFHRRHMHKGDSFFYYTYDRGKSWQGPFMFPLLDTIGLAARTDYIIDGPREATVDGGMTWGPEIVLRGGEGASWDVGCPRIVRRPNGKILISYYWNHALRQDLSPCRYIAATIWDVEQ